MCRSPGTRGSPRSNDLFVVDHFVANADRIYIPLPRRVSREGIEIELELRKREQLQSFWVLNWVYFYEKLNRYKGEFLRNFLPTVPSYYGTCYCLFFILTLNS